MFMKKQSALIELFPYLIDPLYITPYRTLASLLSLEYRFTLDLFNLILIGSFCIILKVSIYTAINLNLMLLFILYSLIKILHNYYLYHIVVTSFVKNIINFNKLYYLFNSVKM